MSKRIQLMTIACAEAIRELHRVPSGELYARVMPHMDMQDYNIIIASLKRAKLVTETSHVLTWCGPTRTATKST